MDGDDRMTLGAGSPVAAHEIRMTESIAAPLRDQTPVDEIARRVPPRVRAGFLTAGVGFSENSCPADSCCAEVEFSPPMDCGLARDRGSCAIVRLYRGCLEPEERQCWRRLKTDSSLRWDSPAVRGSPPLKHCKNSS